MNPLAKSARAVPRFKLAATLGILAAALVLGSCSDSGRAPVENAPPGPAVVMRIIAGDGQTGVRGTRLPSPLVLQVVDRKGDPVAEQIVYFTVTGGGVPDNSSSRTDTDGMARVHWRLGCSVTSSHSLRASTTPPGAAESSVAVVFSATALPGPPHALEAVSGDEQHALLGHSLPEPIAVRVVDECGNGLSGTAVSWTVSAGGRADPDNEGTTDSQGIARARWTLGTDFDTPHVATATVQTDLRATFLAIARVPPGASAPRVAFIREFEGYRVFRAIHSMSADGTDLRRITPANGHVLWFEVSPDGGRIAYTIAGAPGIRISSWDGTVVAVLAEQFQGIDIPYIDWSPDGRRIVFQGGPYEVGDIYVTSVRAGALPLLLASSPVDDANPRWSPDGRQIAFVRGSWSVGFIHLMVMNADGTDLRRIVLPTVALNPRWSPDGKQIAFDNWYGAWVVNRDGSGARPVTPGCRGDGQCDREIEIAFPRWSPDGRQLSASVLRSPELDDYRVYTLDREGAETIPVIALRGQTLNSFPGPQWSPDGRRLTFTAHWDGNTEIYTIAPDGSHLTRLTNWVEIDEQPRWFLAPANR